MAVVGIVPAAGSGERLGASGPKAFALCGGRPLLDWSLDVLESVCDRVVVAVPPGFEEAPDRVAGGPSRSASVRAALAAAPEASVAVVHDAARPLVSPELFDRCVERLRGWGCDGVVAASRAVDTMKEADAGGRVLATLERRNLWAVQTPQAFRTESLRAALATGDLARAPDDAQLVEAVGGDIRIVEAPRHNLKVTNEQDLRIAEQLLSDRA
jgi:2-C-methyl-D-erythritol 4-phosphate cytidylyltransferase